MSAEYQMCDTTFSFSTFMPRCSANLIDTWDQFYQPMFRQQFLRSNVSKSYFFSQVIPLLKAFYISFHVWFHVCTNMQTRLSAQSGLRKDTAMSSYSTFFSSFPHPSLTVWGMNYSKQWKLVLPCQETNTDSVICFLNVLLRLQFYYVVTQKNINIIIIIINKNILSWFVFGSLTAKSNLSFKMSWLIKMEAN